MRNKNVIPEVVIRRLPRYYRLLNSLREEGKNRVSSSVISKRLNITASQVRQDFSHFGAFGLQGYGYDVDYLRKEIQRILCLNRPYNVVVVGAGHIGQALANYRGFAKHDINILSVFDVNMDGLKVRDGVEINHIDDFEKFVEGKEIDICVITTQWEHAFAISERAKACKIPAIWNFSPNEIMGDEHTVVENLNLNESIFTLIFMMNNK